MMTKEIDETSITFAGGQRRRGHPTIFGVKMTRKIEVWVTESQFNDLKSVAADQGVKQSAVIRDAVDSYVGDFRERKVFKAPKLYVPE